jgi:hypothetical protein
MIACWIGVRVPGCARRATAVASAPSLAGSVGACTAHDALDAASATPVAIHRRLLLDTVMVHPFEEECRPLARPAAPISRVRVSR